MAVMQTIITQDCDPKVGQPHKNGVEVLVLFMISGAVVNGPNDCGQGLQGSLSNPGGIDEIPSNTQKIRLQLIDFMYDSIQKFFVS